jgi:hypothetical protein
MKSIASCFARSGARDSAASNSDKPGPRREFWNDDTCHIPDAVYSRPGMPADDVRVRKPAEHKPFEFCVIEEKDENSDSNKRIVSHLLEGFGRFLFTQNLNSVNKFSVFPSKRYGAPPQGIGL